MQPKLHNVNTNPKLRLQCKLGPLRSPVNFGKILTLRKNIHLFVWDFGWDNKNEPKIWGDLKLRFYCICVLDCFKIVA